MKIENMKHKNAEVFKTSFYFGGNMLVYDIIEIDNEKVIMRRMRYLLGAFYSVSIPLSNVVHVDVCKRERGAEILIESYTHSHIVSKGYSLASAHKIKKLIQP